MRSSVGRHQEDDGRSRQRRQEHGKSTRSVVYTRGRDRLKGRRLGENLLIGDDDAFVPGKAVRRLGTFAAEYRAREARERHKRVVIAPLFAKAYVDAGRKFVAEYYRFGVLVLQSQGIPSLNRMSVQIASLRESTIRSVLWDVRCIAPWTYRA